VIIKQSESAAAQRRVPIFLVGTDGKTPATGENGGQPQISKAWAGWANTTNALVGGANGSYYVELSAGEVDTLGVHRLRYKSANTCERQLIFQVVAFDPNSATDLGLSALALLLAQLAEPSVGAPPATPTPAQVLAYLYFIFRNKSKVEGNSIKFYANDGTTVLFQATISADQAQTYMQRDKFASG